MSVLDRLPAWTTTGIGSLPCDATAAAAAHATTAYGLPFCPQLPALDGDMVAEWLGADPARCGWSRDRDRRRPRAWDDVLAHLARRPPAHGLVKLQVTGPLTLARALEARQTVALAREIAAWLAANVAEQVAVLAGRGLDAVLVIDEPALAAVARDDADRAWDPLRAVAPAWGLHVCCAVPWDLVARAAPDLLSFDLTLGFDRTAARAARRLAAAGTHLAWGVFAPHEPASDGDAAALLDAALALTGAAGERSLLTPTCGSGLVSPAREAALAAALDALATRLAAGQGVTGLVPPPGSTTTSLPSESR